MASHGPSTPDGTDGELSGGVQILEGGGDHSQPQPVASCEAIGSKSIADGGHGGIRRTPGDQRSQAPGAAVAVGANRSERLRAADAPDLRDRRADSERRQRRCR